MKKNKDIYVLYVAVIILISMFGSCKCNAQTVKVNPDGNYSAVKRTAKDTTTLKWSGHTYTDPKGKVYQVYVSPRAGKLYIIRTSKSGNVYKQYLKVQN